MKKLLLLAVTNLMLLSHAYALTLPNPAGNAILYEDFYSYSLPILQEIYGDGYRVASTPGAIKDGIVLYTGAEGTPVRTNPTGMDDAYLTPSGTYSSFSTASYADPSPSFSGDGASTWDAQLSAFTSFLNGSDPIFFFNNNEQNSENSSSQILFGRGIVSLIDTEGIAAPKIFNFINTGTTFGSASGNDWVASPGFVDYNGQKINHNLGADEAAFAIISEGLNAELRNWNSTSPYDIFRVRFDLDQLSNGYEQLFILTGENVTVIPEPATLLLFGIGLIGIASVSRKTYQ